MLFFNLKIMLLVNKTDVIQRTEVKGIRQDVKPWEIVEFSESEASFLLNAYSYIFWKVEVEVIKPKKK